MMNYRLEAIDKMESECSLHKIWKKMYLLYAQSF